MSADFNNLPPLTAVAPWYGGKRRLAPRIVAEFGRHRAYWEPLAGSRKALAHCASRRKCGAVVAPEILIINGPGLVEHKPTLFEK